MSYLHLGKAHLDSHKFEFFLVHLAMNECEKAKTELKKSETVLENNFYYFSYTRGLMSTYSTNEDFNTVILETKKEKTKFKGAKGVEDYTFQLSTKTKAVGFRRSFD